MTRLLRAMILVGLVFSANGAFAATIHYISKSAGSDANNGTSKTTPWAHLPGMRSCTGNCASYSPQAGDSFILKGGDSWVASDMPVTFNSNGTSSAPIYIGVDQTWFTGASWARPIFNCQSTQCGAAVINIGGAWTTVDNIEITGMQFATSTMKAVQTTSTNTEIENMYVHGWSHAGAVSDDGRGFAFAANGSNGLAAVAGTKIHNNVVDGSDTSKDMMGGCDDSEYCYNNVFNFVYNGVRGMHNQVYGNLVDNLVTDNLCGGSCDHANGISIFGPFSGSSMWVYNNVVRNVSALASGAEVIWISSNGNCTGCVSYAYNNIIYNSGRGLDFGDHPPSTGGTLNFYNNTIEADGATCVGNGETPPRSIVNYENNHCINASAVCNTVGVTCNNLGNNLSQTTAQADANSSPKFDQYTASNMFSSVASTNSTVGLGINLTSLCSGIVAPLCSDTSYATYNTTNHTVVMRSVNSRPGSGAWDIGAYQYSGGGSGGGGGGVGGAGGAVSLVQQVEIGHGTQTGTYPHPPTATFPSSQVAGDANIVVIEYCGLPGGAGGGVNCLFGSNATGPITSITDTAGNTYTRNCGPITTISAGSYTNNCGGGSPTVDGFDVAVEVWSALNIKTSSAGNVVTANMTNVNNMTGWNVWMFQLHPASGTMVFDQYTSKQWTNTAGPIANIAGTTGTTNYPDEFAFGYCATANGTCPSNTSGWNGAPLNGSIFYDTHSDAAYEILTSKQTASVGFTAGSGVGEWLGLLVTYGSSSSQAQAPQPPTSLLATVQ
jgi:hypothetical protein